MSYRLTGSLFLKDDFRACGKVRKIGKLVVWFLGFKRKVLFVSPFASGNVCFKIGLERRNQVSRDAEE